METIHIKDNGYPKALTKIAQAPSVLYIHGKNILNTPCFAIVGARRCSDYGKEVAFSIAKDLAMSGLTIVSGMAKGIDSFAHKGALEANGKTIAVMGTGLDEESIYPKENLGLAKKILEKGGCLISEYEPGIRGTQFTFPQRNRIISGLSLGVLIVEAKFKSGALVTAKWARHQNKKIFAIPGSVFNQNSKGAHLLIKQGAKLVENGQDILKELKMPPNDNLNRLQPLDFALPREEQKIIELLQQGSLHIEKIIEQTKLPVRQVSAILSLMEINEQVRNIGGNVYALMR